MSKARLSLLPAPPPAPPGPPPRPSPRSSRAVSSTRARTPIAGAIVFATVASLLLGWYWAGAAETEARARAARQRPSEEMQARVTAVADELRRDLDDLLRRESQRPYYHYSNLYRDPRSASTGLSLSPSPLATGPSEPLVADHFQINARGDVTLPTLNDEAPELSDSSRLIEHQAARAQLAAVAPALRERVLHEGLTSGTAIAAAEQTNAAEPQQQQLDPSDDDDSALEQGRMGAQESDRAEGQYRMRNNEPVPQQAAASIKNPIGKPMRAPRTKLTKQVERLDPEVYAQNAAPEQLYKNIVGQQRKTAPVVPVPTPSPNALRNLDRGRVNIVTAPLAWHTVTLNGTPAMVALREVSTPDGTLVQGLTVDRKALERWLGDREAEDEVALALTADDEGVGILDHWALVATPPASALAAAAARADAIERRFLLRFAGVGLAAMLAGLFVVWLMASAERLARERSQFAAAAAHELRTPLAGLQLYGDMLAEGLGDPGKSRDYARRLSEEAARLGRVVANVLGFSQLERGNLSLTPADGDLTAVLRELVARAEPALDRLGAFVEVVMPAALPARFDRDAVMRIVGNLLDNAEKYARAAEDRTITLAAAATAGGAEIAVRDRGPGIDPLTARRLFRPFSRGAGPDRPAGLGLGLALSRSLAEAMGGSLEYRRAGEQTEFLLRLPASEQ